MSQQKVDQYKQNKANRNKESRKEARNRKIEIGILIAVICIGVVWFIVAGVSRSMSAKTETVELKTEAIDNYVNDLRYGTADDTASEDEEIVLDGDDIVVEEEASDTKQ